MARRDLLHKTKLEEFKAWCDSKGIEHRPGRGTWEALQVKRGDSWNVLFTRANMPEHLTVPWPLVPLINQFIHRPKD